jgi:uncharacterized protein (UPF0548 family)
MFLARRPTRGFSERFIVESRELPLSYGPIGLVRDETVDRDVDEITVAIGRGRIEFERARAALAAWKQFQIGWVELLPANARIEQGTVVAVLIRHLGFWSLNGCRVVYEVGERHRGDRFGFAYGTLTNHAEGGEELFEVFFNPDSDDVMYRIRAVSWPRVTLARIGYPIVRLLQARFRRDSAKAMRQATISAGI